jgi:CheY-like chemotaxis protein
MFDRRHDEAVRSMSNSPLLLFVDGNLSDCEYYSSRLRTSSSDLHIVHAATGRSGLAFCERQAVNCVVLEIDLPDMSGFEVLLKLIQRPHQSGMVVLILTRLSNPLFLKAAITNGAQAAFCKGFTSVEILEEAMRKALSTPQVDLTSRPKPEPPALLICHRCRLVHGEEGGLMTKQTYREATGIDPVTCRLTQTDCPFCHDFLLCHPQAA